MKKLISSEYINICSTYLLATQKKNYTAVGGVKIYIRILRHSNLSIIRLVFLRASKASIYIWKSTRAQIYRKYKLVFYSRIFSYIFNIMTKRAVHLILIYTYILYFRKIYLNKCARTFVCVCAF